MTICALLASLALAVGGRAVADEPSGRDRPPQRIVSATLASDEILLEMIGPDRLVAVTAMARDSSDSNCRAEAAQIANHLGQADAEAILALKPDLIIAASYTRPDTLAALQQAGVQTLVLDRFGNIDDIMGNIRLIGERVGCPERAEQMIAEMTRRLDRVQRILHDAGEKPQVAFLSLDGYTAGSRTVFDDIVRRAGGRNAAAEAGYTGFPQLDPEQWIVMDPDWLVIAGGEPEMIRKQLIVHRRFRLLTAVKNDRIIVVPHCYLSSVSQHVVEAVERVARGLHPELDWAAEPSPNTTTRAAIEE